MLRKCSNIGFAESTVGEGSQDILFVRRLVSGAKVSKIVHVSAVQKSKVGVVCLMELPHHAVESVLAVVATVERVALVFRFVELVGLNNPKGNFKLLAESLGDL